MQRRPKPTDAELEVLRVLWALRVLWELRNGPQSFRALRTLCDDVSPTVLNQRLAELRDSGLLSHAPGTGYALTPLGESLGESLAPLNVWAERWARSGKR